MEASTGGPLVVVSAYDSFSDLCHSPKGTQALYGLSIFRLDLATSSLTLLTVSDLIKNPAFLRWSPTANMLYACSESITSEDTVAAFSVLHITGKVDLLGQQPAGGRSACYLTIDRQQQNLLCINYWDSKITCFPILRSGLFGKVKAVTTAENLQPVQGPTAATIDDHLKNRHSEAHVHSLVLDPRLGRIAYCPDLGQDTIRQFIFDPVTGALTPAGFICPGDGERPYGPRYLDFHPTLPVAYLVNECASSISVFAFLEPQARMLVDSPTSATPTLLLIQTISTIPKAFPTSLNTCGRIAAHPSGKFVLVSNRGHNSIAVLSVLASPGSVGILKINNYSHTRGSTPRHFQFDSTGTHLIVANQDTDSLAVFQFSEEGRISFTGNTYTVHSPNFVCCIPQPLHGSKL